MIRRARRGHPLRRISFRRSARWPSQLRRHAAADQAFGIRPPRRRTLTEVAGHSRVDDHWSVVSATDSSRCRYDHQGIVKRSAPLKIQNGMVTHTQTANGQREAPSRWPSRYGQGDEVAAPNESSPGKVLEEIARGRARVHAGHSPRQAPRRYRRMGRAPGDRLSQVTA